MIRGSIYQEDKTIINIYAPKYRKQTLTDLKGETESNTIMTGDFDSTLSIMNRSHPDGKLIRKQQT